MRRLLAVLVLTPLFALAAPEKGGGEKLPPDLALVPHDALWFATVRLADVADDARVRAALALMARDNPLTGIERFGVKAADLERVTAFQRRLAAGHPVVVLHGKKALDRKAILERLSADTKGTVHGKTVHHAKGSLVGQTAVCFADDRTALVGAPAVLVPALAALAKGGKDHPLADELATAAGKHSLVAAARPSQLSRVLDAEMPAMWGPPVPMAAPPVEKSESVKPDSPVRLVLGEGKPEGLDDIADAPLKLRSLKEITEEEFGKEGGMWGMLIGMYPPLFARRALVTLDLGDTIEATMRAEFETDEDAKDSELIARYALFMVRRQAPMYARIVGGDATKTLAPVLKQAQDAARAAVVKLDGKTLTGRIALKLDLRPLFKVIAVEKPAVDESNKLKQIGLAFHNYHDAHGHMIRAVCDKDGKALLSSRVALLPYIEEDKLYKEFKLDEPWDSAHNKKLLARMPKLYAAPAGKAGDPEPDANTTPYQVFSGPGGLFAKADSKVRMTDITDGTSNTFLVAEAAKAVPWTKPEDIDMGAKAFPKLGGRFEKFFHVLMGDGSTRRVKLKADEKALRIWIGPADGMIADEKDITP